MSAIRDFFLRCMRVWRITRKPAYHELMEISKVSAIGILAIGLIGFAISIVLNWVI